MALILEIDDIEISNADIVNIEQSSETINFQKDKLIAGTKDIVLDNVEGDYSKFNSTSIFFGSDWRNKTVTLYDDEAQIFTWYGRIKNIVQNDSNKTVTVKTSNFLRDIKDKTLEYTSTSDITPAEHILIIIRDKVGIDEGFINTGSFSIADNIQDAQSVYSNIRYSLDDNVSCLLVIEKLLELTSCFLYQINDIIYLSQWEAYTGELGTSIYEKNVLPGTFKNMSLDEVVNDYSIAYDNAGTVGFQLTDYSGSLTSSIDKYGKRTYSFPDEIVDSTSSADFKILLRSDTAAIWCGNLKIDRNIDVLEQVELQIGSELDFLHINEQIDFRFSNFVGEPVRITELNLDEDRGIISIKGEFLNLPVNRVSRDVEPPIAPELVGLFPLSNGRLFVKWTISVETDHLGYNLYFSTTPGMWFQEISNLGQSPVDVKSPGITDDGFAYKILSELTDGAFYSSKVTSYDTSLNESEDSNILSIQLFETLENIYNLNGNPYLELSIDVNNTFEGTLPTGFTAYGGALYGTVVYGVSAIYESDGLQQVEEFSELSLRGDGDVYFQWRNYDEDLSSWGVWSSEQSADGINTYSISGSIIQYRILFRSSSWSSTDTVQIRSII